jgi:hypothetical protein
MARNRGGRETADLLMFAPGYNDPTLCHLDRSAAQWRDLRFSGPFLEMFLEREGSYRGTRKLSGMGASSDSWRLFNPP